MSSFAGSYTKVCSDSDEGYYIPPTQLPCLVVQNGSLGICLSGLLVKWKFYSNPFNGSPKETGANVISIKGAMTTEHANKANSENRLLSQMDKAGLSPTLLPVRNERSTETEPSLLANLSALYDEEMNFGIQLQRNSARSFRVGKVPALLGQAGKALFLMKSTLQSLPLFPPGVPKGMPGRIEGIRTRCPRSGAGPPSSLRSNPSRQLWQPVLIALALIPENKKGRNKSGEKGKCLHKGRERKGDSTNKSEKGSKEGTHLDRATTGDRIWKEINMFSRTNRFTPSMTAHQGNNGQSRQRQARMLLPTRPIQGNLTLRAENPSHFRQIGNNDSFPVESEGAVDGRGITGLFGSMVGKLSSLERIDRQAALHAVTIEEICVEISESSPLRPYSSRLSLAKKAWAFFLDPLPERQPSCLNCLELGRAARQFLTLAGYDMKCVTPNAMKTRKRFTLFGNGFTTKVSLFAAFPLSRMEVIVRIMMIDDWRME
nr:hypothetical protein CTI12_AA035400, chloroplastic [Tanacetum cinerariifolium]